MDHVTYPVRMTREEYDKLTRVAKATDRRRCEVLRRLIGLVDTPEAVKLLGYSNQQEASHEQHA